MFKERRRKEGRNDKEYPSESYNSISLNIDLSKGDQEGAMIESMNETKASIPQFIPHSFFHP